MDACCQKRRRYAKSLVVVSLWLALLSLTMGRFFVFAPDGCRLLPRAPAGIRPGWEAVALVLVILAALGEYAAVAGVVRLVGLVIERARQDRGPWRRPSRLASGIVGLALGLCSYGLAFVFTSGGLSKGIDTGSGLQRILSALVSGPALLVMHACFCVGLEPVADLLGFAVYTFTAVLWVLLWIRLALWGRAAMLMWGVSGVHRP